MKKEWETKRLGDFAAAVSTGPFGSVLHKADYVDEGVPLVNPINMVDEGIVPDPSKLIGPDTKRRLNSYVLKTGDVVVARRGEIGRCAVIGPREDGWVCGTGSFFIRPLATLDSQFLAHLIRSDSYREKLEQLSTGTTMKNLSNAALGDLPISAPPLPEQQRIVGVLDEAFAGLATAQAHAEKNLQNARALFESHLQTVFTNRGEGWAESTVEEVVDSDCTLSYGIVQPGNEHPDGLPVVRPTDLTARIVVADGLKRIDPKRAEGYRRTTLRGGELLLCVRGSTGVVSATAPELAGANVTRGIVPIVFEPSVMRQDFGYFLMTSEAVQSQIREKTYGAALMQINIGDLRKLTVSFPPLTEQKRLAVKLDDLSTETQRLGSIYQQKLAALAALRKSLLHQAFSGTL